MSRNTLSVLLLLLIAACTSPADNPEALFEDLEERLLAAENVAFDFNVVSEGVIEGDLSGSVSVSKGGGLTIDAQGSFIGRQLQMRLLTDADSLRMTTSELSDVVARPADTYRAVVLGLTRMGIMHNLASLSTVTPPEHADGGIDDWVKAAGFEMDPESDDNAVSFDIMVEGQRTSGATLVIEDGIPVRRRQVVDFPGGAMIVQERYSNFRTR